MRLSTRGVLAGALLAALAASVARGTFVGVSPFDPIAFGGVAAILVLVALCACLLPARRAARLDPLATLRRS
jgi:ABC-type antimicrobial peptide transport system permease subunit